MKTILGKFNTLLHQISKEFENKPYILKNSVKKENVFEVKKNGSQLLI